MDLIDGIYIVFFTLMVFSSALWLIVYYSNLNKVVKDPEPNVEKSITVIVPAYNEENCVRKCIEALLNQDYPRDKYSIIAVNDGSEDSTLEILKEFEDEIKIIDKENTGKADSMNQALKHVDTELVSSMDADSIPSPTYLKTMVGYFNDEEVYGVTPALKLTRDDNLVEKIQWTEYIYQIFLRKVFAFFDVQYVLPGPGSLYRADFLKETGGWRTDTHTEDMEVAFRMMSDGKKIENSTNAEVFTDPPSTFKALFKQRIRWYKGYLENFFGYRDMFFNPKGGNLGMFLLPLNVLWIIMLLFILTHVTYNIVSTVSSAVSTVILLGYYPLDLTLSLTRLHLFHVFILFFLTIGISTMLLSLFSANEDIKVINKKVNYLTFFVIYPYLFAMFWAATVVDIIVNKEGITW